MSLRRSFWVLPARAGDVVPPVPVVAEVHRAARPAKDERAGDQQVRIGLRVVRGVERPFGQGHVIGLAHETPEFGDRHGMLVDPEAVDPDLVHGPFLGVELVRAHEEFATLDPDHVLGWRSG